MKFTSKGTVLETINHYPGESLLKEEKLEPVLILEGLRWLGKTRTSGGGRAVKSDKFRKTIPLLWKLPQGHIEL